jgi:hypothetical protein
MIYSHNMQSGKPSWQNLFQDMLHPLIPFSPWWQWRWKSMDCINSRRYVTTTGMVNKHYSNGLVWFGSMVFNATFNNISVISWRSVLLVEETEVPGENHRSIASNWQTLSRNVVHLAQSGIRTPLIFIFIVYLYHARISEFAIILKYMMKNNYLP